MLKLEKHCLILQFVSNRGANSGANYPNFFGKVPSAGTLAKLSAAQGAATFVYGSEGSLVYTFTSVREAGRFINCSFTTIKK